MTTEIAVTVAAVSLSFAAGVVWPDVRRRREPRPVEPVDESPTPPAKVVQLPPPAPKQLVRDLHLPVLVPMEFAEEIAVTAEEAEGHEHRPSTRREFEAIRRKQPRRKRRRKGR